MKEMEGFFSGETPVFVENTKIHTKKINNYRKHHYLASWGGGGLLRRKKYL